MPELFRTYVCTVHCTASQKWPHRCRCWASRCWEHIASKKRCRRCVSLVLHISNFSVQFSRKFLLCAFRSDIFCVKMGDSVPVESSNVVADDKCSDSDTVEKVGDQESEDVSRVEFDSLVFCSRVVADGTTLPKWRHDDVLRWKSRKRPRYLKVKFSFPRFRKITKTTLFLLKIL